MKRALALLTLTLLGGCAMFDGDEPASVMAPPAASIPTVAAEPPKQTLAVASAWAMVTPKGAKVAAGYLTIANGGPSDDKLIAASSPEAKSVEIHEMKMVGAVMKMRPLKEGVTVPAGGALELAQGGLHLMFVGIRKPFVEGDKVPVTLTLQNAGTIDVTLDVKPMAGMHH